MKKEVAHITLIFPKSGPASKQLEKCFLLRKAVFHQEQQIPLEIIFDKLDYLSGHLLLQIGEESVGTLRFIKTSKGVKLQRIAIAKPFRGRNLGKLLVKEGVQAIRLALYETPIYLYSQIGAIPFYLSVGFKETSTTKVEANIEHVMMVLEKKEESRLLLADSLL